MKKLITIAFMLVSVAAFMFAEKFEVSSVVGNVTYESAPGKWSTVKVGQKLSESTVLDTSVGARVVLLSESGESITIKSMQSGTVVDLVKANSKVAKGPKKNPTSTVALKSNASSETGSAQGVATASSRAEDVQEEMAIDE